MTKTTYKKIDEHKFEISVIDDVTSTENVIGHVYRNLGKGIKWEIYTYFMPLLEDYERLNDRYFDSVKAGRILVSAWNHMHTVEAGFDTQEYDMRDLYGAD